MNRSMFDPIRRMNRLVLLICTSLLMARGCTRAPTGDNQGGRTVPTNNPPAANAGADRSVNSGATVTLDGSGSTDPDADALSFSWTQTLGTPVTLSATTTPVATFTAPATGTTLEFELSVSDGQSSTVDAVRVSVLPVVQGARITERRQPAVTNDPAVTGDFPPGWNAGPAPQPVGPAEEPEEVSEVQQTAPSVEQELAAGATRAVTLDVAGAAGLTGSVRWVGTREPLTVTLSFNGAPLATGTSYAFGNDRGGSHVEALVDSGGRARLSVTNTTGVRVRVNIGFGARPR